MITISSIVLFIGCFVLVNTSKKATLHKEFFIERWLQLNPKYSTLIGVILLVAPLFYLISHFGTTSGCAFWLLLLMTGLGITILISPMRKTFYMSVFTLVLTIFFLEVIL